MNYDDEHWIKVYTRDTAGWLAVSWQARGLALEIARKLPKKTGELSLGRRGLEALAGLLRAPWAEIEQYVTELIADGRLEYDAERQIIRDPGHVARQTAATSAAERKRRQRDVAAVGVTRGHGKSRDVTLGHEEKRREEKRDPPLPPEGKQEPRASTGTATAIEAAQAYQTAISEQTGASYKLARFEDRDLCDAINVGCPSGIDVIPWLRTTVPRWVQENRGRANFTGGWAPKHFLAWLRSGSTGKTEGGASARSRKELT